MKKHTRQKCFHGSKKIQMAAMDCHLFDCIVYYLLLTLYLIQETCVFQKKCAYYQSQQRQKYIGCPGALLPGKFLRIWKVFALNVTELESFGFFLRIFLKVWKVKKA